MEASDWEDDGYDAIMLTIDEKALEGEFSKENQNSPSNERLTSGSLQSGKIDFLTPSILGITRPPSTISARFPIPTVCTSKQPSKWDIFKDGVKWDDYSPVKKIKNVAEVQRERLKASEDAEEKVAIDRNTWMLLQKAVGWTEKDEDDIVSIIDIKWVKDNSFKVKSFAKIPLLFATVQKNIKDGNCVTLKDASGCIVAGLDSGLCSKYKDKLIAGSCVAVRNCSFLKHRKNLMLTINEKNLICIASKAAFVDEELTLPTWSDYVFFRKPDLNGTWILQFATLDYSEIEAETISLLQTIN